MVPWTYVRQSQLPKRHLDRFSRFAQLTRMLNTQRSLYMRHLQQKAASTVLNYGTGLCKCDDD